jgi:predicted ATPase/DNA-binding winged helix-turn-helix (wHTH) protein
VSEADTHHDGALSFGAFCLSSDTRLLERDGMPVHLGSRAMDILIALTERAGEVVSSRQLIARIWSGTRIEKGSLRFHVAALRKVLAEGQPETRYITNVPGQGYCFVAPISRAGKKATVDRFNDSVDNLPTKLARMVGRDEDVQSIATQLIEQRFVTVVGPGGIGKTTVAISVSHSVLKYFEGKVRFVDLASIADPNLVPSVVASHLGLAVNSEDPAPSVRAFLRDKKMLLVLDSCEHVVGNASQLAECIFREAHQVYILATSRESLRVEGEQVYRLSALEYPQEGQFLTAASALQFPSVKHFIERVHSSGHSFELSDTDAPTVGEICRRLDGIPLAIELAASRVEAFGIKGIATLLEERFELLWRGRRTAAPRHQTLRATLDWSYDLLSMEERCTLRRLSVFVGGFPLGAALAVASTHQADRERTVDALASLVSKSLATVTGERSVVRYRLLDTTRAYALEKLIESDERTDIAQRHALYFRDLLDAMDLEVTTVASQEDEVAYRECLENVRSALEWCFLSQHDLELGAMLAAAAAPLFMDMSLLNECRVWSGRALEALDNKSRGTRLELKLQAALGQSLMFTKGNVGEVRGAFTRALDLAEGVRDRAFQMRVMAGLTLFHHRVGDHCGALAIAERAQALAQETADSTGSAISNWMLCVSHHLIGNQDVASKYCEEALTPRIGTSRRVMPRYGRDHRVRALCARARSLWLRGLPEQAVIAAQLAIDEAEDLGDIITMCVSFIYAGCVFLWVGDLSRAQSNIDALAAHAKKHALHPYVLEGVCMRAELCVARGEADTAIQLLRGQLQAPITARNQVLSTIFATDLAQALAITGEFGDALATIDEAIERVGRLPEWFHLPEMLRIKGEIIAATSWGDQLVAEDFLRRSIVAARRQSALSWELRTTVSLSRLLCGSERSDEAAALLSDVYGRFTEGSATRDLRLAKVLLDDLTVSAHETKI